MGGSSDLMLVEGRDGGGKVVVGIEGDGGVGGFGGGAVLGSGIINTYSFILEARQELSGQFLS